MLHESNTEAGHQDPAKHSLRFTLPIVCVWQFLIDVNAAAMEKKRRAEQAQEEQRLMQQMQALREQQAILAYQIRAPELVMHQPLNTATGTVNGGAVPLPAYNLTAFAPNLQMP